MGIPWQGFPVTHGTGKSRLPSRQYWDYYSSMASTVPPFTDAHAALLQTFLSSPQRPTGTLTYPQLAGWLFSVANGPELIPPSEWMPLVFNDQEAGYETLDEAEQVIQALMALYNDSTRSRTTGSLVLPPGCAARPEPLDNLSPDAPLSQWAQGFLMGYDYLEEVWNEVAHDEIDDLVGTLVMVLSFFASPKLAEAYHTESHSTLSFRDQATTIVRIFPDAMFEYAQLGRALYQARYEAGDRGNPIQGRSPIGRNEPCPCGSGKKFKRCCGIN